MPAYNFKKRFAELVKAGRKRQTVRPQRIIMDRTDILLNALEEIASYGNDGICPYGCDTPEIAKKALKSFASASQPNAAADWKGRSFFVENQSAVAPSSR